ncbi:uncharacterized protein LOC133892299 [Phragmites australis]|uniref:uncharacterized protein LOC133892299 n=1 Tax=Phragmites australis TaxID=29695 RepID=UPI002D7675EA|nr:uncharacterized protein LOC133892299 [Phragmites australis]
MAARFSSSNKSELTLLLSSPPSLSRPTLTLAGRSSTSSTSTTGTSKIEPKKLGVSLVSGCCLVLLTYASLAKLFAIYSPVFELIAIGVSARKASYPCDLATRFTIGELSESDITTMDEAALLAELTRVKGISVCKGVQELYKRKALPKPK